MSGPSALPKKEPFNPFYALLVVVGTLFAITAFAYGVMAFTAVRQGPIRPGASAGEQLLVFLDRHGTWILVGELALLAIATVGAIGSDRYWTERAARREQRQATSGDLEGDQTTRGDEVNNDDGANAGRGTGG